MKTDKQVVADMIDVVDDLNARNAKLIKSVNEKNALIAELYAKNKRLEELYLGYEELHDKQLLRENKLLNSLDARDKAIDNLRQTLGEVRQEKADLLSEKKSVNDFKRSEYDKSAFPENYQKSYRWSDAPMWANWLSKDADGQWWWSDKEPEIDTHLCRWHLGRVAVYRRLNAGKESDENHNGRLLWHHSKQKRPK